MSGPEAAQTQAEEQARAGLAQARMAAQTAVEAKEQGPAVERTQVEARAPAEQGRGKETVMAPTMVRVAILETQAMLSNKAGKLAVFPSQLPRAE